MTDSIEMPHRQNVSTRGREPRQVFLFSGHMVDAPRRPKPRFPAEKEPIAARKIAEALDSFDAGAGDLAIAQGASGGDILFLEACSARGLSLEILLPFPESEFIERSILPSVGGEKWRERYLSLTSAMDKLPRVMRDELGPLPKNESGEEADPFEECNLWLLRTALAFGAEKLRFICLWDGGGGDGPGGTKHMFDEVKRAGGTVVWINPRELW
jgi:hypothetical protein